jgi:hypothetical protein
MIIPRPGNVVMALAMTTLLLLGGACSSSPKPAVAHHVAPVKAPATAPTPPPVIDISRGGGGVPLDKASDLDSREAFLAGLIKQYQARITMPDGVSPITMVGDDHRNLDLLRIDVSNGKVRQEFVPKQYSAPGQPEPGIATKKFEYLASPLFYQNGSTRWHLVAYDARLGLLRNRDGQASLAITDAREGEFEFSLPLAELKTMMMGGSAANKTGAVKVKDVDLKFTSDNPHSLTVEMRVELAILYVPATFRVHGRADIDERYNVRLSELSCKGEDATGMVVAALIEGPMQKMNGRIQPLVRWPGDRVQLTDVQIRLDESLGITAKFAGVRNEPASSDQD